MFSLYIVSDDRTPAFAAVTKPLLPWIFVSTQFKQICALTYDVVTLAILKKSLSDFFQKSPSARWIRRDQLQLEQNLLGELFRPRAKLPNTQNPIEISPAKFCWATLNVIAPLHKQVYYSITLRKCNRGLRLYVNRVRSAQSAVLTCQPHTAIFQSREGDGSIWARYGWFCGPHFILKHRDSVCDLGPVFVCWFLLGCLVFFLRMWKKKNTNQNFKKDTPLAFVWTQYTSIFFLVICGSPLPLFL